MFKEMNLPYVIGAVILTVWFLVSLMPDYTILWNV